MSSGIHSQHAHPANKGEIGAKVIIEEAKEVVHNDTYEN